MFGKGEGVESTDKDLSGHDYELRGKNDVKLLSDSWSEIISHCAAE